MLFNITYFSILSLIVRYLSTYVMEKYALRWKNFQSNVINSFRNVRADADFSDVTLVGDDRAPVPAHKLVLASSSDYFKNILKQKQESNAQLILCLEGVTFGDLNDMLDYIYNGEVQIHEQSIDNFLRVAERFKLEGLMKAVDISDLNTTQNVNEKLHRKENENFVLHTSLDNKPEENLAEKDDSISFGSSNENSESIIESKETITPTPYGKAKHKTGWAKLGEDIEFCSESFESIEALDKTIKTLFVNIKEEDGKPTFYFQCELCSKRSLNIAHMKHHVETHMEGDHFNCKICGEKKKTREAIRAHLDRRHNRDKKLIKKAQFLFEREQI